MGPLPPFWEVLPQIVAAFAPMDPLLSVLATLKGDELRGLRTLRARLLATVVRTLKHRKISYPVQDSLFVVI